MELPDLLPGARVRVPVAASTLYTTAYDVLVRRVIPAHSEDIVRIEGLPLRAGTDDPAQGWGSRGLRARWRELELLEGSKGQFCDGRDCWELAVAAMPSGNVERRRRLRCVDCWAATGAELPESRLMHMPRLERYWTLAVLDCPCGWRMLVTPDRLEDTGAALAGHRDDPGVYALHA